MDDKVFQKRADRLGQLGKVLEKLPAEVRTLAFELLREYVTEQPSPSTSATKRASENGRSQVSEGTEEEFFAAFDHDQAHDNVRLIAASFYREYGAEPFSVDDVRAKADAVGVTIPGRVDMTLAQAAEKGKKLFARAGRGRFKPTVAGETALKAAYAVKKGTKKRPVATTA